VRRALISGITGHDGSYLVSVQHVRKGNIEVCISHARRKCPCSAHGEPVEPCAEQPSTSSGRTDECVVRLALLMQASISTWKALKRPGDNTGPEKSRPMKRSSAGDMQPDLYPM